MFSPSRGFVPSLSGVLLGILLVCGRPAGAETSAREDKALASSVVFDHHGPDAFREGEFSGSGQNLFVDQAGTIRPIHSFDFDGDGYPDILVLNDHNHFETTPAVLYRNEAGQFRSLVPQLPSDTPLFEVLEHYADAREDATFLPALGGVAAAVGDLDGDGHEDIALSQFIHGWNSEKFPLVVYYGGPEGFSEDRRSLFGPFQSSGIRAGDLNGDGAADLVIACRGPEYEVTGRQELPWDERIKGATDLAKVSYVQFGTPGRRDNPRVEPVSTLYAMDAAIVPGRDGGQIAFLEAGQPAAIRLVRTTSKGELRDEDRRIPIGTALWDNVLNRKLGAGDLDGDGWAELLVPEEGGLRVFSGSAQEGLARDSEFIALPGAYAVTVGDFNGDDRPDIAVACFSPTVTGSEESQVFFNNGQRKVGEWKTHRVPTKAANAVAAGDFNQDGFDDVAFASYQDLSRESLDADSVVYFGGKEGLDRRQPMALATFGAVDVQVVNSEAKSGPSVLFVNRHSGRRGFGGGPTESGGMPTFVYWGDAQGAYSAMNMSRLEKPASTSETPAVAADWDGRGKASLVLLTHRSTRASFYGLKGRQFSWQSERMLPARGSVPLVADLDRDGALDLLVCAAEKPEAYLFSGGREGEPEIIPLPQVCASAALVDTDRDGFLDLVGCGAGGVMIMPGKKDGFSPNAVHLKSSKLFIKVNAADLNGDEYPDLVAFVWQDMVSGANRVPSEIYWNNAGQFSTERVSPLQNLGGAHQGSIARVNGDDFLDIVVSNYHGGDDRHLDAQVFLGTADGQYSPSRVVNLPAYSSAANQVMDYNGDGFPDILVYNHSQSTETWSGARRGGKHSIGSWIYWGGQNGLQKGNRSWLPTFGPHNKLNVDPGSIGRRDDREIYTSSWISALKSSEGCVFRVEADPLRRGEHFSLEVAEKSDPDRWLSLPGTEKAPGQWEYTSTAVSGPFRYRIVFETGFRGMGPRIHRVAAERAAR